jgi:5-hydroxyisourate hydrolase
VSVSVSTHVLDTAAGRPAAGVTVELFAQRDGLESCLASGATDADGRIGSLADGLEPGTYRLVFHPPSPFFTQVELQVELGDGHYHVPLLVSPYGCTSYRGS